MSEFKLRRICQIMEPTPGDPNEVEGVLNPAAARGPDKELYLFPRLVAKGNYSRIGKARVLFGKDGDPTGVERMGIALEPEEPYEIRGPGQGGCEDPRITYLEPRKHYIMTYVAFSPHGPRVAIARSNDLNSWERIGLARFSPYKDIPVDGVDNKDSCIFPEYVDDPSGKPSVGLLHRPLFPGTRPEELVKTAAHHWPAQPELQSIWISYWHENALPSSGPIRRHGPSESQFVAHRRLAKPRAPWEHLKIGTGTPPILCRHGWLILYHGVHEQPGSTPEHRKFNYSAGIMILARDKPHHILYRSPQPVLTPEGEYELHGAVDSVVFPTGIDRRDDIGKPDRFDVYYGMADDRIGVAMLEVPETLPEA